MSIEIHELTGAYPGTSSVATNVNFKNSGTASNEYYFYPLRRPDNKHNDLRYSYVKAIYFTVNSTYYSKNLNINIKLSEPGATKSDLFYRFTNTYVQPDGLADHSMTFIKNRDITLFPFMSSSSPAAATGYIPLLQPNVTYYSNILLLQTRVHFVNNLEDVGNGDSFKIKFSLDSF